MPKSPSTKNYTLGKGKLYFNKKDPATGSYEGERDLGNAPNVTFNIAQEVLEHFSSRGGLKAKDKKIISQITPGFNFTLDEVNADNLALLLMSEPENVIQAASDYNTKSLTGVMPGFYYELDKRNIGINVLGYDSGTAIFSVGEVVTGGTSGATATVVQVLGDAASGTLYLRNITGSFTDGETLTGDGTGSAAANGPNAFIETAVSVEDADNPGTFLMAGTDFTVDSVTGRIKINTGVTATNLTVVYANSAANYKRIAGLAETELEGMMRFVSDNPVGNQMELKLWRVSLVPAGDTAMIGDDWSTLSFEGEVLKDEVGHPSSPYLDMIVIPAQ